MFIRRCCLMARVVTAVAMLVTAVACDKTATTDPDTPSSGEFPITFDGSAVANTKTITYPGLATTTTDLTNLAKNGDIGILGVKASSLTATGDNIFSQTRPVRLTTYDKSTEKTTYDKEFGEGSSWTYWKGSTDGCESSLAYWQIGAYHRFRAFHPYDEVMSSSSSGSSLHSESYADQLMIHYSIEHDNYDLLYASAWRYPAIPSTATSGSTTVEVKPNGYPLLDSNDTYGTKKVKLNFHHALAALKFNITLSEDAAMNVDYLEEFYLTGLYASGLFICMNDQENWGKATTDSNGKTTYNEADASYWYLSSENEFDSSDKLYLYTPTDADGKDLTENNIINAFGKDPAVGTVTYNGTEYRVGPLKIFGGTGYAPVTDDLTATDFYPLGDDEGMVFVIPQTPSPSTDKTTYVHFKVWNKDGKTYRKALPNTYTDSSGETKTVVWEKGKIYIYNITVGPVDVKIDVSIEDWSEEKMNLDIFL